MSRVTRVCNIVDSSIPTRIFFQSFVLLVSINQPLSFRQGCKLLAASVHVVVFSRNEVGRNNEKHSKRGRTKSRHSSRRRRVNAATRRSRIEQEELKNRNARNDDIGKNGINWKKVDEWRSIRLFVQWDI